MSLAPGCSMLAAAAASANNVGLGLARHLTPASIAFSPRSSLSLSARLALIPSSPSHASRIRPFSTRPGRGLQHEHRSDADTTRESNEHDGKQAQANDGSVSSSSSAPQGLTGSDLLFLQAEREEASEANQEKAKKAQEQRLNDPAWDGEERLQDTILRMLVDKHQPLKVRSETRRTPSVSSAPVTGPASSSASSEPIKPIFAGPLEGGRYLEKTPDGQPWNAVFVRPAHLQSKKFAESGETSTGGSVYTGKYLAPRGGGGANGPSGYAARLRAVGVTDVKQLPLDDPKKMKAIREALHRVERAGRIGKARDGAADYQRSKELEVLLNKVKDDPEGRERDEEGVADAEGDGEHTTTLQSRRRGRSGPSLAAMSGRAWASLVNERIEEAMRGEDWKNNSLRGKPIAVDVHEWNPHVKGEERIMNRIVQRQGGAPPFVELNAELNQALTSFRKRLIQSWVRRASRIILSGDLKRGLEPLAPVKVGVAESVSAEREEANVEEQGKRLALARREEDSGSTATKGAKAPDGTGEGAPMLSTHAAPTAGQAKLLSLAGTFRDREWEASEAAYHTASIGDLNKVVRRYNAEAPFTARRAPIVREIELERAYKEGQASLAQALSDGLVELRRGKEVRERELRERREGRTSRDLFARMAKALSIGWAESKDAQPLPRGNEAPSRRPESGVVRQVEDDASFGGGPGKAGLGIDEGPDRKKRRGGPGAWGILLIVRRVFQNLVGR